MELVIDANVVSGYFKETVLAIPSGFTGSAQALFERVGAQDRAFLDNEDQMEHEWRALVPREWFDAWYANLLRDGAAVLIPVETHSTLRKKLEQLGFPRGSKDFWYVRTAKAVTQQFGQAALVSEDLDFFDPAQKKAGGDARQMVLLSAGGPVARQLAREEGVRVCCVAGYLASP